MVACANPQFRQHDTGLRVAVIVGLQAGEDEIKFSSLIAGGEASGGIGSVPADEGIIFEMDGAVPHLSRAPRAELAAPVPDRR